ncbi:hypothetical protein FOCG_13316 [Fusarium oxysporum f. sp. radicis-lycopersici 26381]|uniref:Uncharacterized protein n=3 Tax=Fusarium oxysporum TaxID=5507 RepID=A0A4Q2VCB1_FUSOX|nr:hypothetical protein FOZG_09390 [Fusarium oxysporum Fo47]EXL44323.1 hypothetical protein FOCG_13316 [Fusarium oxysporum f. sp. radicis-lycopersici 26381]RKK16372.1 hypothetical protein BFJ65_g9940 [Fusarium oxysporum f. sp. cepae]RYC82829.1 hypothetical protein BFJ63_vAg14285 [Fusarium oxysporum f. sp. narcissi]RKK32399.1 hypothetical protein BFJ66_g15387 [Fusarium oxysporum f. sp. cepae]
MKLSIIFFTFASVSTAMAAVLPESEVEIPGKLVSRDEFELAIRQAGCSACIQGIRCCNGSCMRGC